MQRRWDKSKRPTGPFALNQDCPQAQNLTFWSSHVLGSKLQTYDHVGMLNLTGTATPTADAWGAPALRNNGTSDAMSATQALITGNVLSLHAFVSIDVPANTQGFFGAGTAGGEAGFLLCVGSRFWALSQDGGGNAQSTGNTVVVAGTTYGVGGIWASTTSRLVYVNGIADGTVNTTSKTSSATIIKIGNRTSINQWHAGVISEGCAWNVAVDASILARINDPAYRFELWYPLRSRKWISIAGGGAFTPSISEAASAADTASQVMAAAVSIAEAASAADSQAAVTAYAASIAESTSSADTCSAVVGYAVSIAEAGSAVDTQSAVTGLAVSITETGAATDTQSAVTAYAASIAETASAVDTQSAASAGNYAGTVTEAASAVDTQTAVAAFLATVTEAASAVDTQSASSPGNFTGIVAEAGSAADTSTVVLAKFVSVTEAGGAVDTVATLQQWLATITEAAVAADLASAALNAVVTNSAWWAYDVPVNDMRYDVPVNNLRYDVESENLT